MQKPLSRVVALALVASAPFALAQDEPAPAPPETPAETAAPSPAETRTIASYALGYQIGGNFTAQQVDLDLESFIRGLRAATAGEDSAYTAEQKQAAVGAFQQQMAAEAEARVATQGAANLAAGQQFLAENAQREGVRTLDSGLQIEVLAEGTGDSPDAGDQVQVHYTGTLIDGTPFDSSRERGEPATFPLEGVIPGFSEGLRQLKEGGRAKLYIPPAIGYGERGVGPIPPSATLIFDVELIDVIEAAAAPVQGEDPAPTPAPEQ